MKTCIYNYTLEQLEHKIIALGLKKFNATQIFNWLYKNNNFITSFPEMKNISKASVPILQENFIFDQPEIVEECVDSKTGTIKFLLKLHDDNLIETVIMRFDYGNSICISSQVGCNMGCRFCASGLYKKIRNLTTSEIIGQLMIAKKYMFEHFEQTISNIVFMGVGEPLDNIDNVIDSIKIITNHHGISIGSRHITISTCGLANKIVKIASELPQVNLAISLHAPIDKIRDDIMPINKAHSISELIDSIKTYLSVTNRRVSFEYILLKDINDSKDSAIALSKLLKGMLCYVNIIPYNKVLEHSYEKSERTREFSQILKENNIDVTIRLERGIGIEAACGQLRIVRNAK